ncbi:hypothetical protein EJ05DRAFT_302431 [Pseudovirgaria hyperparasitica]|uniref:Phenylacetaldoxime dehydratase n=1 Tax=Pseudovirgaria hyperparasitica TaxID=470096 RepID=A0A6A6WCJ1_9PEZI|nr:uncharacterized protein EJ05DRAFT_302431 [Pseudovirgaria hyperparasitica]KAF2759566.1 hypothetical protein EJ05DRAFT_302431 [Pseudovirgaria hyperparasitica]
MSLEAAIPPHLRTTRSQPLNTPPSYTPPVPAYTARFPQSTKHLVIAIYGAQTKSLPASSLHPLLKFIRSTLTSAPEHWDTASSTDSLGYQTHVVIAYWHSSTAHAAWSAASGFEAWWADLQPGPVGWFKEVFTPPIDRVETVFSDRVVPEGVAHMREDMSGEMREHVYWGSMRDRMPVAQTDALEGEVRKGDGHMGEADGDVDTAERRVRVRGQRNLCVIRSGQDWSDTRPEERKLYLETMHPVLEKGMWFLRDEGGEIGCLENRLMTVLDPEKLTTGTDKTFGLGYFDSMESLEKWSREHPTHMEIFGGFLKYVKQLDNDYTLRLFNEVLVLQQEQQDFEYIGCHPKTGMLSVGPESWIL